MLARSARILDAGGLHDATIFVSGSLDEYRARDLLAAGAPIDGFGIGSRLDTSADAPYLDCAYKLQEYAGLARRKRSEGKATWPGRKQAYRRYDGDWGCMREDIVTLEDDPQEGEPLIRPVMRGGRRIRHRCRRSRNHALAPQPILLDYQRPFAASRGGRGIPSTLLLPSSSLRARSTCAPAECSGHDWESKRVGDLLRQMQRERFHMALVTDEYGSVSGLVTLEDLLEELVGIDRPVRSGRTADAARGRGVLPRQWPNLHRRPEHVARGPTCRTDNGIRLLDS